MNIKEMSLEELIARVKYTSNKVDTVNEYNEILSRFSALEAKVKELEGERHTLVQDYGLLKIDNDFNKTYLNSAEELIAELQKQVEDLKCCGNCGHYTTYCTIGANGMNTRWNDCCKTHWQSDNLTKQERET